MKLDKVTLVCIDNLHIDSAQKAIDKSCEKITFGDVLFLQPKEIKSVIDYSYFVMYKLAEYVKTSHMLIIQSDGYVINPELWKDDWLKYDYIGAPWWYDNLNVGNGGFSLRSKRLMQIVSQIKVRRYHPEDDIICRQMGVYLQKEHGIWFAPEEVAEKFSFEQNGKHPVFNNDTFGFHGLRHLIL
jgi:hypothetical protein